MGSYVPAAAGFEFKEGALYRALENGSWFLSDEFNLAEPSVMSALCPLFEGATRMAVAGTDKIVHVHPNFRFFATQNDASYASRHKLPLAMRSRFIEVQVGEFSVDELGQIIELRKDSRLSGRVLLKKKEALCIASVYNSLVKLRDVRLTMREVVKWVRRAAMYQSVPLWMAGASLLCPRCQSSALKPVVEALGRFASDYGTTFSWDDQHAEVHISQDGDEVRFEDGQFVCRVSDARLDRSRLFASGRKPPLQFQRCLVRIAHAAKLREPVLLVGPTSMKSLLVRTWAEICNVASQMATVHLTPLTETPELIGQMKPCTNLAAMAEIIDLADRTCMRARTLSKQLGRVSAATPPINAANAAITSARDELSRYIRELKSSASQAASQAADEDAAVEAEISAVAAVAEALDKGGRTDDGVDVHLNPDDAISADKITSFAAFAAELLAEGHASNALFGDDTRGQESLRSDAHDDPFGAVGDPFGAASAQSEYCPPSDDPFGAAAHTDPFEVTSSDPFTEVPMTVFVHDDVPSGPAETLAHVVSGASSDYLATDPFGAYGGAPVGDPFAAAENPDTAAVTVTGDKRGSVVENGIPATLVSCLQEVVARVKELAELPFVIGEVLAGAEGSKDTTLTLMAAQLQHITDLCVNRSASSGAPLFLFADGPVTLAAKQGFPILLESLDTPSAAVIERLNSLLEPDPTFTVTEDITVQRLTGDLTRGCDIALPSSFQVFATVHRPDDTPKNYLSAAARSRFTEIIVPSYKDADIKELIRSRLEQAREDWNPAEIADIIVSLPSVLKEHRLAAPDLRQLLRVCTMICRAKVGTSIYHRLVVAARFFAMEGTPAKLAIDVIRGWTGMPASVDDAFVASVFGDPADQDLEAPVVIEGGYVTCSYTGVAAIFSGMETCVTSGVSAIELFPTPTLVKNIARVFACISAGSALLLEGPPGVGKTAVCTKVAKMLGRKCERINCASNTSLDALFGGVVPRFKDGVRVFEWQDGVLSVALKQGSWLLFDEINLAPPEVLDGLAPLLDPDMQSYALPDGSVWVRSDHDVRFFVSCCACTSSVLMSLRRRR